MQGLGVRRGWEKAGRRHNEAGKAFLGAGGKPIKRQRASPGPKRKSGSQITTQNRQNL